MTSKAPRVRSVEVQKPAAIQRPQKKLPVTALPSKITAEGICNRSSFAASIWNALCLIPPDSFPEGQKARATSIMNNLVAQLNKVPANGKDMPILSKLQSKKAGTGTLADVAGLDPAIHKIIAEIRGTALSVKGAAATQAAVCPVACRTVSPAKNKGIFGGFATSAGKQTDAQSKNTSTDTCTGENIILPGIELKYEPLAYD